MAICSLSREATAIRPIATPDEQVSADDPVRLMDAFIDKPELQKVGFGTTLPKSEGRPAYAPAVLLKLYLYGCLNKVRSSRKPERTLSLKR